MEGLKAAFKGHCHGAAMFYDITMFHGCDERGPAGTTEYYLGHMTARIIACISNGATVGLCGRANLAQSV